MRLVWAGHEPQEFINLFPDWQPHTEVAKINKEVRYFTLTSLFYMRQNWVPISLGSTLNIPDLCFLKQRATAAFFWGGCKHNKDSCDLRLYVKFSVFDADLYKAGKRSMKCSKL